MAVIFVVGLFFYGSYTGVFRLSPGAHHQHTKTGLGPVFLNAWGPDKSTQKEYHDRTKPSRRVELAVPARANRSTPVSIGVLGLNPTLILQRLGVR